MHINQRLGLSPAQREKLYSALRVLGESRDRARARLDEVVPQLDELLRRDDASDASLAGLLRGGLATLEREIDGVAGAAGTFLDSLDPEQREKLRTALRPLR